MRACRVGEGAVLTRAGRFQTWRPWHPRAPWCTPRHAGSPFNPCRTVARFVGKVQLILEGLRSVEGLDALRAWPEAHGGLRVWEADASCMPTLLCPGSECHAPAAGLLDPQRHPVTGHPAALAYRAQMQAPSPA